MNELKEIKTALELLHASPNAITFFLASYKTGKSSVGQIAKQCWMDRSSAYIACEQLKELGVLEEELRGKRKFVSAKPPKAVLARLRSDIRKRRRHAESLEEAMSELLAEYKQDEHKPVLQFFSGKSGLCRITDDLLENADDEILVLSNQREEQQVFTRSGHEQFIQERARRGIRCRVLAPDNAESHELKSLDKGLLRETRIVSGEDAFSGETYIYGDRVAMLSFHGEMMGFIVCSKDFARTQRWAFEEIWNKYE